MQLIGNNNTRPIKRLKSRRIRKIQIGKIRSKGFMIVIRKRNMMGVSGRKKLLISRISHEKRPYVKK